ncbi:GAF domain-containing protein, partial [Chloroflexota bacterium]
AVDNVRLFQETGRRESETRALYHLGVEISRLMNLDRILTTVVDSALRLSEADATILTVYDDISREVYVQAVSGALPADFKNFRLKTSNPDLISEVVNRGQAKATLDYLNDPSLGHGSMVDSLFRENGLKSCLAVPVKIGEQVSGVLMALYKEKDGFSEWETGLLQQFANQAAVALENTRLHNQVQELAIVEERTRLSREMHDSLGQVLGYLGLQVDEIKLLLDQGKWEQAAKKLEEVRKTVNSASEDIRHLILALRTPVSTEVELPSILREYLDTFQSHTGIKVTLDIQSEEATRFSTKVALQLVRVIQEALSNVRKHAQADRVEVRFEIVASETVVSIIDNGSGFDPSQVYDSGQHFGIQVMDERMTGLGGSLEIESKLGHGTKIRAKLPLERNNES